MSARPRAITGATSDGGGALAAAGGGTGRAGARAITGRSARAGLPLLAGATAGCRGGGSVGGCAAAADAAAAVGVAAGFTTLAAGTSGEGGTFARSAERIGAGV